MGATACVVIPWFADRYAETGDWRPLAWFVHDRLPYSKLCFFPKLVPPSTSSGTTRPARRIDSYVNPKGCLTRPGMPGFEDDHAETYAGFPPLRG